MDITTLRVSKRLRKRLRKHEIHPRETYEQIIERLISDFEAHKKKEKKK